MTIPGGTLVAQPSELSFPILVFDRHSFDVKRDTTALTIVHMSLVKSGWFDGLRIVDREGKSFEVASIRPVRGVGPFWGLNLLYGRRVELAIELRPIAAIAISEVRSRLLALLEAWHGWQSREDFDELVGCVSSATSLPELIGALERAQV